MILILLGAPGAGKGTQSRVLSGCLGIPVISTGEILRDAAAQGTAFGKQVKACLDRGELVPDSLIIPIVLDRLREPDCQGGFLLDGFPRTIPQAEAFDRFLAEQGLRPDAVVHLVVDSEELVRRLSGRRICSRCGANYHLDSHPPQRPGVCDLDGAPLIQREDDRPELIRQRLEISDRETAPVAEYYERQGLLTTIDGSMPQDEVTREIKAAMRATGSPDRLGEAQAGQPGSHR
jgi:adenylate kinase